MERQTLQKKPQFVPTLGPPLGVTMENLGNNLSFTLNLRLSHVECETEN